MEVMDPSLEEPMEEPVSSEGGKTGKKDDKGKKDKTAGGDAKKGTFSHLLNVLFFLSSFFVQCCLYVIGISIHSCTVGPPNNAHYGTVFVRRLSSLGGS